jgi:ketosteroid isomerase-like protein
MRRRHSSDTLDVVNEEGAAMSHALQTTDLLVEAVRTRDTEAVIALYSPGAVVVTPEGTFRGTDEIRGFIDAQFTGFPDFAVTVHRRLGVGDTAVYEATAGGTHLGPIPLPDGGSIEPTGRRVEQRLADVIDVEDGRVVRQHRHVDAVEARGA